MEIQQNEKDKKSKSYLMILIAILAALNIGIGYTLYKDNQKKNELTAQNIKLTDDNKELVLELQKAEEEIKTLQTSNQDLTFKLTEKDQAIADKISEIKTLLSKGKLSTAEVSKAKSEIAMLRGQIAEYKAQIDKLTIDLKNEQTRSAGLESDLGNQQAINADQSKTIDQQNKRISLAKKLNASTITVMGVRERKLFGKKEVETSKASKVEEIKVRFVLDKNEISDAGDKDIFVKLVGPDGSTITSKQQTTKVDGTETLYTEMKTIDYKNEKHEDVLYLKKQSEFKAGEYTIEIFSEGYKIGSSKLMLK